MDRKSCFSLFLFFTLSCGTSWHLCGFDIAEDPGLILLKREQEKLVLCTEFGKLR